MKNTIIPPKQDIPLYLSGTKTAFWMPVNMRGFDESWDLIPAKDSKGLFEIRRGTEYVSAYVHPPYAKGQRIAVREKVWELGTHGRTWSDTGDSDYVFNSHGKFVYEKPNDENYRVHSAGAMPAAATRMWLVAENVEVKRMYHIKSKEACDGLGFNSVTGFDNWYKAKYGQQAWEQNPYIFIYTIKIITEKP
jgi:hypothetical protein